MKQRLSFCIIFLLFICQSFVSQAQQKILFKTEKFSPVRPAGGHLFLSGDFNSWNPADTAWRLEPDESGGFYLLKQMLKGTYHFKITRGSWPTVECSASGKPIDNRSVLIAHDTTITMDIAGWQDNFTVEKQHTASAQVHIIREKFDMPQLGRTRRIWIYLPADYQSSKKRYPVIYMQDGQNLFDDYTSAFGEWGIDEIMDKLPAKDQCIIVGIDNGGEYRMTEYNPYKSKYGKGRGTDYVDFMAKTLKPYIDKNYRTKSSGVNTTIAGSSMGGLISMYAALKYPRVFGNAGIFSPAFWTAPKIYKFAAEQKLPAKSRFYFVCGDAESESMVADMQKMADIIRLKVKASNAPVIIVKGAGHNEKQWTGDFPGFYSWLMGGSPKAGKAGSPKKG